MGLLENSSVNIVCDNYGAPGTADRYESNEEWGVFIYLPGKGGGKAKHPRADVKEINYGLCDSSKYSDLDILGRFINNSTLKTKVNGMRLKTSSKLSTRRLQAMWLEKWASV